MKLRNIALSMVLCGLVAGARSASAQDGAAAGSDGWNDKYGIIFELQNPFRNSADPGVVDGVGGGIGFQYALSPSAAIRATVGLNRSSDPVYEVKRTDAAGTTTQLAGTGDSSTSLKLGASYVMRLTQASFAPYVGAGVGLSFTNNATYFEDTTVAPSEITDESTKDIGFGVGAQLGVEWRLHKSFALIAEYGLNVDLLNYHSINNEWKNVYGANTTVKQSGSQTRFFTFDTGVNQQGQIGLVAFF